MAEDVRREVQFESMLLMSGLDGPLMSDTQIVAGTVEIHVVGGGGGEVGDGQ